jgi:hypothetical protein
MNKVNIKEKEIGKIGFDHDRDKVYNTTNKKMTNEKKATIGTIVIVVLIILSFLIRPIGEFFLKLVLGILISSIAVLLMTGVYYLIHGTILDILDWIDDGKQNK